MQAHAIYYETKNSNDNYNNIMVKVIDWGLGYCIFHSETTCTSNSRLCPKLFEKICMHYFISFLFCLNYVNATDKKNSKCSNHLQFKDMSLISTFKTSNMIIICFVDFTVLVHASIIVQT